MNLKERWLLERQEMKLFLGPKYGKRPFHKTKKEVKEEESEKKEHYKIAMMG